MSIKLLLIPCVLYLLGEANQKKVGLKGVDLNGLFQADHKWRDSSTAQCKINNDYFKYSSKVQE